MNFYGLSKKIKNARNNGFKIYEIVKLTMKNDSSLPNKNKCYYLKIRIPKMHEEVFRKISQDPEYVKYHSNDRNNPFLFACRKFISEKAHNLTISLSLIIQHIFISSLTFTISPSLIFSNNYFT